MTIIGNYVFDADRLIFYETQLDSSAIEKIQKTVPNTCNYLSLKEILDKHKPEKADISLSSINKTGICLTNCCNLRCNYCGDSIDNKNIVSLSEEDISVFITDILKRWTIRKLTEKKTDPLEISFTGGGEPTYNWSLFEKTVCIIHERCSRNNIPIFMFLTTNGMLTDPQREFIANHFNRVMVSYDGLPEIQIKNRHSALYPDTAKIAEDTIQYFIDHRLKLTIRTTIWQDDFHRMKEMAEYLCSKFGERFDWSILPVIPMGRALNRIEKVSDKLINQDFLEYYLDSIAYFKEKYGEDTRISTPMFPNTLITLYCGGLAQNCSSPWLLPDKTVVTCIEPSGAKTVIGKLENNKVLYYEHCSDPLLKQAQQKFTECLNCIAYRFCRGGCPAKHLMGLENPNSLQDWECKMIQKYWLYVFSTVLKGDVCFGWEVVSEDINGVNILRLTKRAERENEVKQC